MNFYLVGGAVRDQLLGLPEGERDWLVTGAKVEEMIELGFQQVHGGFPVFLHPQTGEEYALARREIKTDPGYHGFSVQYDISVTLEEDLARRDLTINAMAMDAQGNLIDPFNGQDDLRDGILRHVTPAFQEDPVRVLRVARFAAKLGKWGFRLAHGTHALMLKMVASDDFISVRKERWWQELNKAMATDQPWRFFEVLDRCGALKHLWPPLARQMGAETGHQRPQDSAPITRLKQATLANLAPRWRLLAFLREFDMDELKPFLPLEKFLRSDLGVLARLEVFYQPQAEPQAMLEGIKTTTKLDDASQYFQILDLAFPNQQELARSLVSKLEDAVALVSAEELKAQGLAGQALGDEIRCRQLAQIRTILHNHE